MVLASSLVRAYEWYRALPSDQGMETTEVVTMTAAAATVGAAVIAGATGVGDVVVTRVTEFINGVAVG